MIVFTHVYKTYLGSTHALKNVSLTVERGDFFFLTGPSGAGKSTFFRLLSAFDRPTSGQVKVMGFNLSSIKDNEVPYFRRRIGVVYQDFKLLHDRTVFENVALPLEVRGDQKNYVDERVCELLDQVGLINKRGTYSNQLSGGEQQRVAIARALVHHPGILVADEPTGNLDPEFSESIMDLLDKANAQGTTVFVATHDYEMVKRRSEQQGFKQQNKKHVELQGGRLVRVSL